MRGALLDEALETVAPIVADVRTRGDAALLEWTERLDGPRPDGLRVDPGAIEAAVVDDEVLAALRRMIDAVRLFSVAQRPPDTRVEAAPGIVSERRWLALDSVGLCVPSGRSPLPSSLVMTAVPALVAGVRRIAVVTPSPSDAILVAARELGLDEVYAVGGAQAVAALAYGTETIPAVDAVIGPGSAYVTAAKLLVASRVRIDLPAGPSEVVAIADAGADAARVAADLLAQAEHGDDSEAVLFTDDATRRGRRLRSSFAATGTSASSSSPRSTRRSSGPMSTRPSTSSSTLPTRSRWPRAVRNAGSVFVGCSSVVGDYAAGATHVLPTGGLARSTGGLGLEAYMKPLQVVTATPDGARRAAQVVVPLARVEGLPRHAEAAA